MRTALITVALALVITAVLPDHALAAETRVTMIDWREPAQQALSRELFDKYEQAHPGVKVDYIAVKWGEFPEKVLAMIAGGSPPDILAGTGPNILDFYDRGLLQDWSSFMKRDGYTFDRQFGIKFPADLVPIVNGAHYAIPYAGVFWTGYFNANLFDEAGLPHPPNSFGEDPRWTWEGLFRDYAVRLTRDLTGDGITDQFGIFDLQVYDKYPLFFGGQWISSDGNRFLGTDQPVVEALDYLYRLRRVDRVVGGPWPAGKSGMVIGGVWNATGYATAIKDTFTWGAMPIPQGRVNLTPGSFDAFWLTKDSRSASEAWELVKFLTSPEGQRRYVVDALGLFPTHRDSGVRAYFVEGMARRGVPMQVSQTFLNVIGQANLVGMPYNVPGKNTEIAQTLTPAVNRVLSGEVPARVAMETVRPVIEQILKR